ncbi:DUF3159 domain-containing protein [Actinomycetospora sp. CA-101289]|uniref:DUF3159 domain-containing protein n=1 Tax=Actinomycetospora sp. CA-101289 TaxID=3239893 RepID=UPI003D974EBA
MRSIPSWCEQLDGGLDRDGNTREHTVSTELVSYETVLFMTTLPRPLSPEVSPPPRDEPLTVGDAARRALESSGGLPGIAVTAAPTVAFVIANALGGLTPALISLAGTASAAFVLRIVRRERLTAALVGLVIAAVSALVAAVTGEARAFFLLPMLLPVAVLVGCLGSVLIRRPLTGLLLNRVVGGPSQWRRHRGLMRVYIVTTLIAVAVNVVNVGVQAVFYLADRPAVLAAAHVATGPVFAALVAATVIAARRQLTPEPTV